MNMQRKLAYHKKKEDLTLPSWVLTKKSNWLNHDLVLNLLQI